MSTSTRPRRAAAGFTLLEIMVTLAVVGIAIMSALTVREESSHDAYRSTHLMMALTYAQDLLADRMTDPEVLKDQVGIIEEDPAYHYQLSIEKFDLSTGRVDEDDGGDPNDPLSINSQFAPPDAGVPPGATDDQEDLSDPNLVRRIKVTVTYPGLEDGQEGKVVIEGFIPRATEKEPGTLLGPGS